MVSRAALIMENAPPEIAASEDARLVLRARGGDANAFEALAARHVRTVLGLIRQSVRDEHVAQDVAQESFLSAYVHLNQLDDPHKFAAWLYRIALRQALKCPARSMTSAVDEQDDAAGRDEEMQDERRRAVRAAVGELEEPYRLVVTLRYLEGLDAAEIAERIGVAHGTVRSWLSRVRPILREKLSKHLDM